MGCRQIRDKKDLLRIVHTPEDSFLLDTTGKARGRGAYICPRTSCIEAAFRKGALEKSLHCRIPAQAQETIIRELTEFEKENP